jgi:aspartate-semialdehyde dehydrogenase
MKKLDVAILGASGAVGQRFIQLLENHPWFRVAEVVGKTSAGKAYGDATHWILDGSAPESVQNLVVKPLDAPLNSPLVFSALPKEAAIEREFDLASKGHVVATNASANRMVDDVPLLLPEINCEHIKLIDVQRKNRGWTSGALVANSNCTVMPVVMSLYPLLKFGIDKVFMVSEQAISGAGYPGVASLDIIDNIVPYVPSDEEKMETESRKMLGKFVGEGIQGLDFVASTTCTRVPVIDGHVVNMSISLKDKPTLEAILHEWRTFQAPEVVANLPSSPHPVLHYLTQIDRPQPRRDRNAGNGMATSIGRLRACSILDYKFATLSHNTIRGAAGCSILNAELLAVEGYIHGFSVS